MEKKEIQIKIRIVTQSMESWVKVKEEADKFLVLLEEEMNELREQLKQFEDAPL
jgi:hypothetical protein